MEEEEATQERGPPSGPLARRKPSPPMAQPDRQSASFEATTATTTTTSTTSSSSPEHPRAVANGCCGGPEEEEANAGDAVPLSPLGLPDAPSPVSPDAEGCESPAELGGSLGLPRRSSIIKDSTRQKRERKKTVSFGSMPTDRRVSSASDCINLMLEGCELRKIRPNSRVYQRYFLLESDLQWLRWEPSKKDSERARLEIVAIREVRVGKNTETFRNHGFAEHISADCAFSIIYGEGYESLDLVASAPDIANAWVTGLRYLLSFGSHSLDMLESSHNSLRHCWLLPLFTRADGGGKGCLPVEVACQLLQGLNPALKGITIRLKLKELQKSRVSPIDGISFPEFVDMYHELCTRAEIYFLLVQFSSSKEYLDSRDLTMFLEAEQGMTDITEQMCSDIIRRYEPSTEGQERGFLGIDGFTGYLISAECDLFDPAHRRVCQDMSQPISHYYINSSHNTYLIEDQFRGPCDVSGYVRALRMGCRCVEMDVWDGPDGEPIVYNGHTMTLPITFHSALEAINKYAFVASEYPLIICLENHNCVMQQKVLVQHIKKVLGDKLYIKPVDINESYLPSPESLKLKIILKGKKLPFEEPGPEGEVTDEDEASEIAQRTEMSQDIFLQPDEIDVKKQKLCPELSDLITLCKSVRFRDFDSSQQCQKYWEMCSFTEALASRFSNEFSEDFVNHNKRFLSRIFPSPMRIDSSNLNPQDFWNCGCQVVGMNYQTPGLMMDLNVGWFRQNGGCGYVLRPSVMRDEVSYFSANVRDGLPGISPQLLHIKVISGQHLPKPRGSGSKGDVVDPYVYVEVHGIPADCAEQRTKTIGQNGGSPVFDESFVFQVNLPELAIVRFVVLDDDYIGDEFIGQYTIPFECLQPGYRHVPLHALTGECIEHANLFLHVAITNRRGGGKAQKRGLSVRKGKKTREYAAMRLLGVRAPDEVFRMAAQPLHEATDLRENMQNWPRNPLQYNVVEVGRIA
ncbi:inactive phospholipase C-like protein 2 isoform X2 [Lampetra planeri]